MELSWSWQKSSLRSFPNLDCGFNHETSHFNDFSAILLWVEDSSEDFTVNVLNSNLRWRCHVDGKEVSLQSVWNIILTTTWVKHCSKELQVLDTHEETSEILLEEIESLLLNELSGDFKSDLVTPSVNEGHGDIIDEHGHQLTSGWLVSLDLLLLKLGFD
jgi:hypothetical protein